MRFIGPMARLGATRGECLFVDRVNRREVWVWTTRSGVEYMGQSRFGTWVARSTSTGATEEREP